MFLNYCKTLQIYLRSYYLTLITQRKVVGSIEGNAIYGVKGTELFPIKPRETSDSNSLAKMWRKLNQRINQTSTEIAESRYMGLFQFVDVSKDFFFSYDYDLTNSLQHNYLMGKARGSGSSSSGNVQDMFVWNHYLTEELADVLGENASFWLLPLIHGSYQQVRQCILSTCVMETL